MATKKTSKRFGGTRVFWAPRVLAMRKTMGLSQRDFARLVGVSVKTLQNWEQGRRQLSGPAAVRRIRNPGGFSLKTLGTCLSLVVSGCVTNAVERFPLHTVPSRHAVAPVASHVPIRVNPLAIAPEVYRQHPVSERGKARNLAAVYGGSPPSVPTLRQLISDDLSERLPPGSVIDANGSPNDPVWSLTVFILEFGSDEDCTVTLRTSWSLTPPHGKGLQGNETVRESTRFRCSGSVADSMSRALAQLTDRFAWAISAE
jgi:DNA-binding XRE family transcriptional regulator/uncharacterized lipoprotein YmbA